MEYEVDNEVNFSRQIKHVVLGQWQLSPKHQTLNDGDIAKELEPLLFGILAYLVKNNDRIIGRQELADEVWKQSYVDDNAINRAMSQLRKALKSEKQRAQIIKTHYRVGYSLTVVPEIVYHTESKKEDSQAPTHLKRNGNSSDVERGTLFPTKKSSFLLASLLTLAFAVSLVGFRLSSTSNPESSAQLPLTVKETLLTWKKGISVAPLMSKNGRYLAYTFKGSDDTSFDLFIKNTETLKEIRLSEGLAQIYPIAWSENNVLFYQIIDVKKEQPCQVWKVNLATASMSNNHQKVFDCYGINLLHADTADSGNTLLYTKFNYRNIPNLSSIVHRDLNTNTEFQISSPQVSEFGDYFVKVSHSGDKVVILRHQAKGVKILVANIDGSNPREIISFDYFVEAINWSQDDSRLFWLNRDNSAIATLSMDTLAVTYQPLDTEAINGGKIGIDLLNENTMVIATDYADTNLYSLDSNDRQLKDFSSSNRLEISASSLFNKRASIYIVGWQEQTLWMAEGESRKELLATLPGKKVSHVSVAPDDAMYALANKDSIYIYNTDSPTLKEQINPPGVISDLSWVSSNSLLVTLESDDKANAWLYELSSKKYALLASDIIGSVKLINDNTLVYLNNNHNLIKQNPDTGAKSTLIELSSAAKLRWAINDQYIYYSEDAMTVYRTPLDNPNANGEQIANTREKEIWKLIANDGRQQPELFLVLIEQKNNVLLELAIEKEPKNE